LHAEPSARRAIATSSPLPTLKAKCEEAGPSGFVECDFTGRRSICEWSGLPSFDCSGSLPRPRAKAKNRCVPRATGQCEAPCSGSPQCFAGTCERCCEAMFGRNLRPGYARGQIGDGPMELRRNVAAKCERHLLRGSPVGPLLSSVAMAPSGAGKVRRQCAPPAKGTALRRAAMMLPPASARANARNMPGRPRAKGAVPRTWCSGGSQPRPRCPRAQPSTAG